MHQHRINDSDREILVSLRDIAGEDADLSDALESTRSWLGITEKRPPSLVEVISYVLAHRGREPAPRPHPDAEDVAGPFLRKLSGDPYGVMGRVQDRSRWPFDALRSPIGAAHGPATRFYTALCLGVWHRWHLWPSRWMYLVHSVRILGATLLGLALVPVLGMLGLMVLLGYALGSIPAVNRVMSMPIAVALFNSSLAVAVQSFPETMERARQVRAS